MKPGNNWHPSRDRLAGTSVYGTEGVDANDWSVNFASKVPGFDQFLFATGDCAHWLIANVVDVNGNYANAYRNIQSSSKQATPYQARWYNRNGVTEDPWISVIDHSPAIGQGEIVYGENRFGGTHASAVLPKHGGADVYIRKAPSPTPVPTSRPTSKPTAPATIPRCIEIRTASSPSYSDGNISVSVDKGDGNGYVTVLSNRYFDTGVKALNECYPGIVGVRISGPTTDGWAGSIKTTGASGGGSYSPMRCTSGCTGSGDTDFIAIDGDASDFGTPISCFDGNTCTLVPTN